MQDIVSVSNMLANELDAQETFDKFCWRADLFDSSDSIAIGSTMSGVGGREPRFWAVVGGFHHLTGQRADLFFECWVQMDASALGWRALELDGARQLARPTSPRRRPDRLGC
jgi:hypothetical protein